MLYPIHINMETTDEKGEVNIVAIVFDYHPSKVQGLMHTLDGNTSIFSGGQYYKVLVPYKVMTDLYHSLHRIDNRFKDEVDMYFKDNYKAIKTRKAKDRYERGETD